jgi:hypothetical protein
LFFFSGFSPLGGGDGVFIYLNFFFFFSRRVPIMLMKRRITFLVDETERNSFCFHNQLKMKKENNKMCVCGTGREQPNENLNYQKMKEHQGEKIKK